MVESNILYERLADSGDDDATHKLMVSLIHESFADDFTAVSYFGTESVCFEEEWVDAGRFRVDEYTVTETGVASYKVKLSALYEDRLPRPIDEAEETDFFETVDAHIIYKLTITCAPDIHSGEGRVLAVRKY